MDTGKRISLYRKQLGMTQVELAKQLNVKQSHISRLEKGVNQPSTETLKALSQVFSVSVSELLGENDSKQTSEQQAVAEIARKVWLAEQRSPGSLDTFHRLLDSELLATDEGLDVLQQMMNMIDRLSEK